MEFKIEKKGTNKAIIEVEVEAEKFEEGLQKSYLKKRKIFQNSRFQTWQGSKVFNRESLWRRGFL